MSEGKPMVASRISPRAGITRREFVRRSLGTAALAGLGVGGLAACGGGQEQARGGQGSSSGEPVEIEYWHINSEALGGPALKDLVRHFTDANKDVKGRPTHKVVDTGLSQR